MTVANYSMIGATQVKSLNMSHGIELEIVPNFPISNWITQLCQRPRLIQVTSFLLLLGFIAIVSVHDAALLIVNQDAIQDFEKNPIGSWLIQANSGSVSLFVLVKLLGTSLVCAVLASIYEHSSRLALIITSPLAIFQAMLLTYLYGN